MKKILAMVAVILLVSVPAIAQEIDYCEGNFDYDQDVDGTDAAVFKEDFGRSTFDEPCPPPNPAPTLVRKTGQTTSYATGDDGDLERGIGFVTPRFTDNSDGTVTDNQTGLIWLKNANCFGARTWYDAKSYSNGLADGSCGLTDGSSAGDWILPNSNELASLVHKGYINPTVPNTAGTGKWIQGDPFNNVQFSYYWSSSTEAGNSLNAWVVGMSAGVVSFYDKSYGGYVWPVRGGQ